VGSGLYAYKSSIYDPSCQTALFPARIFAHTFRQRPETHEMQLRIEPANDVALPGRDDAVSGNQGLPKFEERTRKYRLAVLTSHVIQYQDPLFEKLAAEQDVDLTVFFCSEWGAVPYRDPGFGREVQWDLQRMREGYRSQVLRNWAVQPHASRFWGLVNPGIAAKLATGKFDAVWVHGWSNCTTWIAMLTAFTLGLPVLLRGENHRLSPASSPFRESLKRVFLKPLFRHISGFLAIGSLNAEYYRAYGVPPRRIFNVPYSVDNKRFMEQAAALRPARESIRARLGIGGETPVVLFSGKLIPNKAPMDLLRAFEGAVASSPAHLIFLGDGQLMPELKQYVASRNIPNVHFAGFRNQSELPEFFVASDIFALPSRFERWGLVVNEALCFGLPVVVSNQVGASADLVEQGRNGFVFPSGDIPALRDCLIRLFSDDVLRHGMAQASQRRIQHWDFEADIAGVRAGLRAIAKESS
jgi:glycosyltransferase involved in cell wall biosynthesis